MLRLLYVMKVPTVKRFQEHKYLDLNVNKMSKLQEVRRREVPPKRSLWLDWVNLEVRDLWIGICLNKAGWPWARFMGQPMRRWATILFW